MYIWKGNEGGGLYSGTWSTRLLLEVRGKGRSDLDSTGQVDLTLSGKERPTTTSTPQQPRPNSPRATAVGAVFAALYSTFQPPPLTSCKMTTPKHFRLPSYFKQKTALLPLIPLLLAPLQCRGLLTQHISPVPWWFVWPSRHGMEDEFRFQVGNRFQ